ncbi:REP-associated tyrosine transposase [Luteimonas sp. SDU82]|uniref:REP-associated tyrosine transposase n=1 Tax=Luteimonas sp. SDU82 TaxID=3422592 RepID=UPI003EBE8ACF
MSAHRTIAQSHRLRLGRHSVAGQPYLLTFTTARRQPFFRGFDAGCQVSRILSAAETWPHGALLAWVLMPDHWHGLFVLGDGEDLSRSVARAKSAPTRQWHFHSGSGPLWAPGFHDHGLRREESLLHVARYIVLNPVRAGLVRTCADYPFWDAVWLESQAVGYAGE